MTDPEVRDARRPITVDDLDALYEPWELEGRRAFELLAGEIHDAAAVGPPHVACVNKLTRLFVTRLGEGAIVQVQSPIELSPISAPQPDLALLAWRADDYTSVAPGPRDVLLVVEVADSSYRKDSGLKLSIYAEAGIAEVWIVRLETETLEAHSGPEGDRYRTIERFGRGDRVAPRLLPESALGVDEILPWPATGGRR